MTKTVVCSVGTSAAKAICPLKELPRWVAENGGPRKAGERIYESFRHVEPEGDSLRSALSAEIHSLVRIGLDQCCRVILLASATDDGHACALAIRRYLEDRWPSLEVDVFPVPGMQVSDPRLFKQQGAVEYCKRCLDVVNRYGRENVILNPTGGYKALVPYAVLVGMLKRVPCRYIFEQSSVLMDLPPLPVEFQRGLFEVYRNVFERIEQETTIPRLEWERSISHQDRESLAALFEVDRDQVTLSGVGLLFLDEVRAPTARAPFLSTQAWRDCLDNLSTLPGCDPFRFLDRVARSEKELELAEHVNVGNGMRWLKPGRTTDRYLVSIEGWRLLVWRAVREDEVGTDYPHRVKIEPRRDRNRYAPFTRMELHF
jgi:putative CRISPR-associated protein (TIGR02619 family)